MLLGQPRRYKHYANGPQCSLIHTIYIKYHLLIFTIFPKYVELSAFSKDVDNFNTLAAEAGVLTARITKVANKPTSSRFKSAHTTVIYFPKKHINIILAFTSLSSKCLWWGTKDIYVYIFLYFYSSHMPVQC